MNQTYFSLHNEITSEPDQGEEGPLQGGRKGKALAAEGAKVGGLHRADVALCWDRVVGKSVALEASKRASNASPPHSRPTKLINIPLPGPFISECLL